MSIATVVTRGYGSFSTVNKVPVRGYSHAAAVVVQPNDGWTATTAQRHFISSTATRLWISPTAQRTLIAADKDTSQ